MKRAPKPLLLVTVSLDEAGHVRAVAPGAGGVGPCDFCKRRRPAVVRAPPPRFGVRYCAGICLPCALASVALLEKEAARALRALQARGARELRQLGPAGRPKVRVKRGP